jgi:hypothetical protein
MQELTWLEAAVSHIRQMSRSFVFLVPAVSTRCLSFVHLKKALTA